MFSWTHVILVTSLTNKKEGFEFVMLTITSSVRLYSETKTNLLQIEYFHIIDHNFQCDFQILLLKCTRVC